MSQVDDELGYILRSETRTQILRTLSEQSPLDRGRFDATTEASRRTVNRAIAELEELGYISHNCGGFRLTAYGAIVTELIGQWKSRQEFLTEYQPFLSYISPAELGFEPLLLRNSQLTTATEMEPYAALDRLLSLRREATDIQIISPLVERAGLEQALERVRSDDLTLEAVIPESMYEQLTNGSTYTESFIELLRSPSSDIFVYPEEIPAFFGLFDRTATVAVSVNGIPYAMVESTHEAIVQSVREQFTRYRDAAKPIAADSV